jgi:hypothetical protein
LHHELRFDGFPTNDYDKLRDTFQEYYSTTLEKHNISSAGTSYGKSTIQGRNLVFSHMVLEDADEEGEEFEARVGDELMSLDLAQVSQCVLPGNNRHEIELQFPESDTLEAGTDQLGTKQEQSIGQCDDKSLIYIHPNSYFHIKSPFAFTFLQIQILRIRTEIHPPMQNSFNRKL